MTLRGTLVMMIVLLAAACATAPAPPPEPSLAERIDAAISRPPFDHAFWSILVEEQDGRVLYALNEEKLTIPASNRKLFASAAIVECLGVDGRLSTEVWLDGEDVVVRGGGDPSLGSWRYERGGDFAAVARQLRDLGVTRVRDVIADVSLYDRDTFPGGWKHGNHGYDYAAPVDALAWEESEIANDQAVDDPGAHAATALRDALLMEGIEVTGAPRMSSEPRVWRQRVTSIPSPFVGQLLGTVLKNSHNLYAEMLLKRLSVESPLSYAGALARERVFLEGEVGIDGDSFSFVDGSGLAPDDLVTPRATVRMLRWMNDPLRRGFWWAVLAQPANEGTLRRRLAALEHRFRGKTGTINGVNALSGIVAMPDGSSRYFVAVVNHHATDGDEAVKIIDEILGMVAE